MPPSSLRRLPAFAMCVFLFLTCIPHVAQTQSTPARLRMEVVVAHGRVEGGPRTVKMKRKDTVTLSVTSDASDELHLHGFDRHIHLKPGQPASLEIIADRTGRFTVELHRSGLTVGVLEVYPQ